MLVRTLRWCEQALKHGALWLGEVVCRYAVLYTVRRNYIVRAAPAAAAGR